MRNMEDDRNLKSDRMPHALGRGLQEKTAHLPFGAPRWKILPSHGATAKCKVGIDNERIVHLTFLTPR